MIRDGKIKNIFPVHAAQQAFVRAAVESRTGHEHRQLKSPQLYRIGIVCAGEEYTAEYLIEQAARRIAVACTYRPQEQSFLFIGITDGRADSGINAALYISEISVYSVPSCIFTFSADFSYADYPDGDSFFYRVCDGIRRALGAAVPEGYDILHAAHYLLVTH